MADIEKLLLLDAIWTDLLVQEPPLDARQARVLRVLADDLVETLEAVSRSAPYIEEVVQSDPAGSYASFRKNLAQAQLDSRALDFLGRTFSSPDDLVNHIGRCVSTIIRQTRFEREALLEKKRQIETYRTSTGDLTEDQICSLAGLTFGFGLVTGNWAAVGFGIGVAAGAGCF
jgi:hypothetical protein